MAPGTVTPRGRFALVPEQSRELGMIVIGREADAFEQEVHWEHEASLVRRLRSLPGPTGGATCEFLQIAREAPESRSAPSAGDDHLLLGELEQRGARIPQPQERLGAVRVRRHS